MHLLLFSWTFGMRSMLLEMSPQLLGKSCLVFFSAMDRPQSVWWEGGEQGMSTVWVVLKDVGRPLVEAARVDVTQWWEWRADNHLSCFYHQLSDISLRCSATEHQTVGKSPTGCAVLARRSFLLPLRATLQQSLPDRHLYMLSECVDILPLISIDSVCIPGVIHCFAPASGFPCRHVEKQ